MRETVEKIWTVSGTTLEKDTRWVDFWVWFSGPYPSPPWNPCVHACGTGFRGETWRPPFQLGGRFGDVGMLRTQLWIINDVILIQQFVEKTADTQLYIRKSECIFMIFNLFWSLTLFCGIQIHEEAIPTFDNDPIIFKPSSNDFVFKTKPQIGVATNAGLCLGAWGATCKGGGALPAATVTLRLKWKSFGAICLVRNYVWIVLQYLRRILKKHMYIYSKLM